jgi:hypothetical protein
MKLSGLLAVLSCALLSTGQEVHVSAGKNSVVLSVAAQKPYSLMSGEEKKPLLAIECAQKGKKTVHILKFQPGGMLVEDNPESGGKGGELVLAMTTGGAKEATSWIPDGDTEIYAYYGKTEPERMKFILNMLGSLTVSIEFKPFLTGVSITSVFDISRLRDEMGKHPECAAK